jgi:peptidoglycan-N-acetylglucosamine deacetylase
MALTVAFTVDVEPDCPPYLQGWRGVDQGMPALLDLLAELEVPATMFTTGESALRAPAMVQRIVSDGHELACHAMTHRNLARLDEATVRWELAESSAILRQYDAVTSFRAPYLGFRDEHLPLLVEAGYTLDSSQGRHRLDHRKSLRAGHPVPGVRRVPASTTSSVLRLPRPVRGAILSLLGAPVVLFVHPWEFVDLRRERLRWDCRFRTGPAALAAVRDLLGRYRARGATFARMRDL